MQPTDPGKFTEKAWEAIVKSQDVARSYRQQNLEVEHVAIALLDQEGLANTILDRSGIESARLRQQLDSFAARQPKVNTNDLSQLFLGRGLDTFLDRAEDARKVFQDEYIAVEHLVLALCEDDRVGRRLFKAAG
ncbi:MAG: ATP-dependent chaperone ClpB, partial [Cyanobacteria bacterium J069]